MFEFLFQRRRFLEGSELWYKIWPAKLFFFELLSILKRMNLEIEWHSSFSIIVLEFRHLIVTVTPVKQYILYMECLNFVNN